MQNERPARVGWVNPILMLALLAGSADGGAGEFARLRDDRELTPERLLGRFADFAYELSDNLQDAETFLQRKRGDCDDFASLAGRLLAERGCHTKLVVIMMEAQTHVVCYVREAKGFLDFNRRAVADSVVPSDGSLEDIANKVAAGFRSRWWMVSEFEYRDRGTVFLDNVFPPAPAPAPVPTQAGTAAVQPCSPGASTTPGKLASADLPTGAL